MTKNVIVSKTGEYTSPACEPLVLGTEGLLCTSSDGEVEDAIDIIYGDL